MTAEEQRFSIKRSEYAFITIMNTYKKKDVYNYMTKAEDGSILNPYCSKNVMISGEPNEYIKLVQNKTKTHV